MDVFEMKREAAREDTIKFHAGQQRKWSEEPYHTHPIRVADAILNSKWGEYEDLVIAAYGHDWLEDCEANPKYIMDMYGEDVLNLILEVTDVFTKEKYPTLNRHYRKVCEFDRINSISRLGKVLKIFDRLDNLSDNLDAGFAPLYLSESSSLLIAVEDVNEAGYVDESGIALWSKLYTKICQLEVKFGV